MRRLVFSALLASSVCWAKPTTMVAAFEGFVDVEPGISLYARVIPGQPSAPIIVLLNGLTQDTDHWNTVVPFLQQKGATIVNIDLALQGRSMVKRLSENFAWTRPVLPPLILTGGLWSQVPTFPQTTVVQQSDYVSKLLLKLNITTPVVLAGLSYGGGLALQMAANHPNQVSMAILAAPFVFPLPSQDNLIKYLMNYTRQLYPQWYFVSDDNLYDLILRGLVTTTYYMIEPETLKWSPPFESIAVSELVRGIRHLDYQSLLNANHVPLHLVIAGNDQYIPRAGLETFWADVPNSMRGSSLIVSGSEHKMNESVGPYFGSWIWELASNTSYITNPGNFMGQPVTGVANEIGGSRVVKLQPATPCETYLNPENSPFKQIRDNPSGYLSGIISWANPNPTTLSPTPSR